jgi:hypothetical protein
VAAAPAEAQRGQAHLVYVAESALPLLPLIRAMGRKGRRVRGPTPGQNHKHAFCGARDAVTGQWVWAAHPRKRAVPFVAFREQIVAADPTGRLDIALDGAPAPTAQVVQRWAEAHPRLRLLRLPP